RTGDGNGTLTFGTGTINANQVQVGVQLSGGGSAGRGTLNINNDSGAAPAKLTINGDLVMAVQLSGNTEATGSAAAINVNGGILEIAGNAIDGGGNMEFVVEQGGTLSPAGDIVGTLNITSGSLRLEGALALDIRKTGTTLTS